MVATKQEEKGKQKPISLYTRKPDQATAAMNQQRQSVKQGPEHSSLSFFLPSSIQLRISVWRTECIEGHGDVQSHPVGVRLRAQGLAKVHCVADQLEALVRLCFRKELRERSLRCLLLSPPYTRTRTRTYTKEEKGRHL